MTVVDIEPLWSVEDLSRFLGVPVNTLYQWRTRKYGPRGKKIGRHVRYKQSDVYAWLDNETDSDDE